MGPPILAGARSDRDHLISGAADWLAELESSMRGVSDGCMVFHSSCSGWWRNFTIGVHYIDSLSLALCCVADSSVL